jgi:hypothetical protein
MLGMIKLDIAGLQKAYDAARPATRLDAVERRAG